MSEISKYDVVIIGAGPAGCAAALALRNSGLKTALIDKASFPRDKICGDAIPHRAFHVLRALSPKFADAFKRFPAKCDTKKVIAWYKGKDLTFNWDPDAYSCTRMEFDNFLFNLVKENTDTHVLSNTTTGQLAISSDHIAVPIQNTNNTFATRILIGADGGHSTVARQLAPRTVDPSHHVGTLRAFYSNVAGDSNTVEIFFERKWLTGYFWIFPLPGNMWNVGFGMLSKEIAKGRIALKKAFYEVIDQSPILREKFRSATQVGELEGLGLPLGSRSVTISGNRFMLAGDAASLADPITGDGIGNAMLSGKLAAEQAMRCFKQNDFSAGFIKSYDTALWKEIGSELKNHYRAQRMISTAPFLLDVIFTAGKSKLVKRFIAKDM